MVACDLESIFNARRSYGRLNSGHNYYRFLGAGKTTLLNRILTEEHGQKIAVIENEFGEESIDNDLLVQSEDEEIITMNNGCICCTIRGDLAENLIRLMERKRKEMPTLTASSLRRPVLQIRAPLLELSSWMKKLPSSIWLTASSR